MVPFAPLRKLTAHEKKFASGMSPHEAKIGAQIGELLPLVTWHLLNERAFAIYNFIMGKRQHEVFRKRVDEAKSDLTVMITAIYRLLFHVVQRIVHPPHVPFVVEA